MKRSPSLSGSFGTILPFLLVLLASFTAAQARPWTPVQEGFVANAPEIEAYAPDRVLVRLTPTAMLDLERALGRRVGDEGFTTTGLADLDRKLQRHGMQRVRQAYSTPQRADTARRLGVDRWMIIETDAVTDPAAIARDLATDPSVEHASVDWRAFPAAVPNDPLYPDQWGHNNTAQMLSYDWSTHSHENGDPVGTVGFDANAEAAWTQGYGASGVIIAILDSGVDIDHPDLRLVAGYDFGDNDSNPDDNSAAPGHGTACAGVAAAIANNNLGVAGIAGGASIMPVKVADSAGSMYFSAIQNALYWAADNGADVISMSLGAAISSDPATDAALQYAYNAGCVILAATGNENASTISYPAVHDLVIGVGAASPCGDRKRSSSSRLEVNPGVVTDPNGYTCDGERWWGSNYGSTTPDDRGAVDVIAPTILPTTDIGGSGGYASGDYDLWFNGTSAATPYAAGVAALVISSNPGATPAQVRDALTSTAQDIVNVESGVGWDRYSGYGMVDAAAAIGGGGPVAPVAAFGADTVSGNAPLTVTFDDQSSGSPTTWSWDFGDGTGSTLQNPSHTYDLVGTYSVSLTVTNAVGSDTVTKTDFITATEPGAVLIATALQDLPVLGTVSGTFANTQGADGVVQTLTESLSNNHPRKITSWAEHQWRFDVPAGDSVTLKARASRTSGDGDDFAFAWSTDQATWTSAFTVNSASMLDYVATLPTGIGGTVYVRVVDTDRNWDRVSLDTVSVDQLVFEVGGGTPTAPVAGFTGTPTSGNLPLTVQFSDASTGSPTSWSWDFGDGGVATTQNPSHVYAAVGTYTVSLTVSNDIGSDSLTRADYIVVTEGGGDGLHVASIAVSRKTAGVNISGLATVVIQDASGAPVANAVVTGVFTGPTSGTVSGTTLANGAVSFESAKTKNATTQWCFEVTDVAHTSLAYDAGANAVTKACEDGNVFAASAVPTVASLSTVPNPFNPATEIRFSLTRAGAVRLEIFDPRGRRVAELVDADLASGEHSLTWKPDHLSSGVYFLRLQSPDGLQTKRMLLIK